MDQPASVALAAARQVPFRETINFRGIDLTGGNFRMQVRQYPDAIGDPLIALDKVDTAGAEGLCLTGVAAGTVPISTIEINITQAKIGALPVDGRPPPFAEDVVLAFDLLVTPTGLPEQRLITGDFVVRSGVSR